MEAEETKIYTCSGCKIKAKVITTWYMVVHAGTQTMYCSIECLFNAIGEEVMGV